MFRVSQHGEGIGAADTIEGAREIVQGQPSAGRYDVDEIRAEPFPSGHTSRSWAQMIAEIREGKSGDIFPDDFLVFPRDFQVSLGRMSHKIPSIWPAPQLLKTRGLTDPSPLKFGRFLREFRCFLAP